MLFAGTDACSGSDARDVERSSRGVIAIVPDLPFTVVSPTFHRVIAKQRTRMRTAGADTGGVRDIRDQHWSTPIGAVRDCYAELSPVV